MNYRTDVIYCELDVDPITGHEQWLYFHSPDGVGRIYHPTAHEAKEQTGLTSMVHLI